VLNLSSYWEKTLKVFSVVIVSVLTTLTQQQLAQKCLTHLERDLEALKLSRFEGNRFLAVAVAGILTTASAVSSYKKPN
jgi:hypothetical protein